MAFGPTCVRDREIFFRVDSSAAHPPHGSNADRYARRECAELLKSLHDLERMRRQCDEARQRVPLVGVDAEVAAYKRRESVFVRRVAKKRNGCPGEVERPVTVIHDYFYNAHLIQNRRISFRCSGAQREATRPHERSRTFDCFAGEIRLIALHVHDDLEMGVLGHCRDLRDPVCARSVPEAGHHGFRSRFPTGINDFARIRGDNDPIRQTHQPDPLPHAENQGRSTEEA